MSKKISLYQKIKKNIEKNRVKYIKYFSLIVFLSFIAVVSVRVITPYVPDQKRTEFYVQQKKNKDVQSMTRAKVESINGKKIKVKLIDGQFNNQTRYVKSYYLKLKPGDIVILDIDNNVVSDVVSDFWRIPGLIISMLVFILAVIIAIGKRGAISLVGLFTSVLVISFGLIPAIFNGANALTASIIIAFLIATISISVAHGFKYQTFVSVLSIYVILGLTIFMAWFFGDITHLSGVYDEISSNLSISNSNIDMRGVLLGGIIIATLGVLDDVVTTQTEAIYQIKKASKKYSFIGLFKSGYSVGREHVVALVNTLALAYIGASLPLVLVYVNGLSNGLSWKLILNSEFIAQEVMRTLISSTVLVFAIPIATFVATVMIFYKSTILSKLAIIKSSKLKGE